LNKKVTMRRSLNKWRRSSSAVAWNVRNWCSAVKVRPAVYSQPRSTCRETSVINGRLCVCLPIR